MSEKFEGNNLDYLKHIEKSLRTAPHKQINGGVLVAEILVDSIDGWCEFLREIIATAEADTPPPLGVSVSETVNSEDKPA